MDQDLGLCSNAATQETSVVLVFVLAIYAVLRLLAQSPISCPGYFQVMRVPLNHHASGVTSITHWLIKQTEMGLSLWFVSSELSSRLRENHVTYTHNI